MCFTFHLYCTFFLFNLVNCSGFYYDLGFTLQIISLHGKEVTCKIFLHTVMGWHLDPGAFGILPNEPMQS